MLFALNYSYQIGSGSVAITESYNWIRSYISYFDHPSLHIHYLHCDFCFCIKQPSPQRGEMFIDLDRLPIMPRSVRSETQLAAQSC